MQLIKEKSGLLKPWIVAQGEPVPGYSMVVMRQCSNGSYDKVKYLTECVFYTDGWEAFAQVLPQERHIVGLCGKTHQLLEGRHHRHPRFDEP